MVSGIAFYSVTEYIYAYVWIYFSGISNNESLMYYKIDKYQDTEK